MAEQTTKRRSKWQALAARKYSRMTYIGGDGGQFEAWVVLTKCPHEQTRCWRYSLRPTKADAEALLARWNTERCAYHCKGTAEHTLWKLA
jgi:hypothetical protein